MNDLIKTIDGVERVSVGSGYFSPAEYIQNLLDQLRDDIFPMFSGTPLFTIARNTFCFIDHVSALKYGVSRAKGEQTIRMRKLLGEFAKIDKYFNEKYKRYADFIIQVYRHDLVHNIRPFPHKICVIEKDGTKTEKTSWFFIIHQLKNPVPSSMTFETFSDYFIDKHNRKGLCHLRYNGDQVVINNFCLFFDLVNYLRDYAKLLKSDSKEQKNFIVNYESIVNKSSEIKNFVLDKTNDKECIII